MDRGAQDKKNSGNAAGALLQKKSDGHQKSYAPAGGGTHGSAIGDGKKKSETRLNSEIRNSSKHEAKANVETSKESIQAAAPHTKQANKQQAFDKLTNEKHNSSNSLHDKCNNKAATKGQRRPQQQQQQQRNQQSQQQGARQQGAGHKRPRPPSAPPSSAASSVASRLPIASYRTAIIDAVRRCPVTVLVGETGSGKTTQVPQYLLQAGLAGPPLHVHHTPDASPPSQPRQIVVTQPRRVAAITVARRVASEMGVPIGGSGRDAGPVGYSVRFEDATGPATRIKFATDGMLLR